MRQQNLEKEARIKELKEKLQQVKVDEGRLQSFKTSMEIIETELEEALIDMYAHLHMFQDLATIIIDQHSTVQTKLTQFNIIWEGMNNINTWIVGNSDAHRILLPLGQEKKNRHLCTKPLPGTRTKGRQRNYQLNGNLFAHMQSNTIITQVMPTSPPRGAWEKSYNGRTGRQGTIQHKL